MAKEDLEQAVAESFMFGMALGFGSKYDEKDEILKSIIEIIDEKENKRKYKIGDKVRTLVDKEDVNGVKIFPKGKIGTITKIIDNEYHPYKVEADGDWWYYNDDMIELVDDDKSEQRVKELKNRVEDLEKQNLTTYQLYLILLGYITEHTGTDKDDLHGVENALLELYKRAK